MSRLAPDIMAGLRSLGDLAATHGLDKCLIELIKIRASQINGCAYCLQYHILTAERLGVDIDRINLVAVWRDAPIFSDRERAALAWTEALTLIASSGVGDEVYEDVRSVFSETELLYLSSAIVTINAWNRFGAALRWTPPPRKAARA